MDLQATYDAIAEAWHEEAKRTIGHRLGLERFCKELRPGASVLDIGCGTGIVAGRLLALGASVTGIDLSEGMLEVARREAPGAEYFHLNLLDASRLGRTFDAICASAVFLHIPRADFSVSLQRASDALRSGGLFYVSLKERDVDGVAEEVVHEYRYKTDIDRFFSYYTQEEIESAFASAGIESLHVIRTCSGKAKWIEVLGRKR